MFQAGEGFIARRRAALVQAVIRNLEDDETRDAFVARGKAWIEEMMTRPYFSEGEVRWLRIKLDQVLASPLGFAQLLREEGDAGDEARHSCILMSSLSREEVRRAESLARSNAPIVL